MSSAEEIYALCFLVEPPLLEALAATITGHELSQMCELLARMEHCMHEPAAFQQAHRTSILPSA